MWQLKAGIAAIVLAAFGYVLFREHMAIARANKLAATNVILEANLTREREIRATMETDRKHADETAQALAADLARIRSEPRITGVRICRAPAATVPTEGRSASGIEGASAGRVEGTAAGDSDTGIDISDAIDDYATDCATVGAIARRWQEWDAARTH